MSVLNTNALNTTTKPNLGRLKINTTLYLAQVYASAGLDNYSGYADYIGKLTEITEDDIQEAHILCREMVKEVATDNPEAVRYINKTIPAKLWSQLKEGLAVQLYGHFLNYQSMFSGDNKQLIDYIAFYPRPEDSKIVANCHKMFSMDRMTMIEDEVREIKDVLRSLTCELQITSMGKNIGQIQDEQQKLSKLQSEHPIALKYLENKVVGRNKTTDIGTRVARVVSYLCVIF